MHIHWGYLLRIHFPVMALRYKKFEHHCSFLIKNYLFLAAVSLRCITRAHWLWSMGLIASWHAESSLTRDQTHVCSTGRQIPNHWTTR